MSRIRCYTVGRDPSVSVVLPHNTVSRRHAEMIPVAGGEVFVTDCASTGGTFVNEGGRWQKITQSFVAPGTRLRFGEVEVSVERLLTDVASLPNGGAGGEGRDRASGPEKGKAPDISQGVMRDPETGEPIALGSD